jgi:hypothetical protein
MELKRLGGSQRAGARAIKNRTCLFRYHSHYSRPTLCHAAKARQLREYNVRAHERIIYSRWDNLICKQCDKPTEREYFVPDRFTVKYAVRLFRALMWL